MNIVYAYGGATIFPQIIAEMRRPMDFLKSFAIAQALIFVIYVFYGLYVYSFQGQFTLAVAFQGVSKYSWQVSISCKAQERPSRSFADHTIPNTRLLVMSSI